MRRVWVVLGGLGVVALVFWLKVEHAVGVCADAHGRWVDGDCLFEERVDRRGQR